MKISLSGTSDHICRIFNANLSRQVFYELSKWKQRKTMCHQQCRRENSNDILSYLRALTSLLTTELQITLPIYVLKKGIHWTTLGLMAPLHLLEVDRDVTFQNFTGKMQVMYRSKATIQLHSLSKNWWSSYN